MVLEPDHVGQAVLEVGEPPRRDAQRVLPYEEADDGVRRVVQRLREELGVEQRI